MKLRVLVDNNTFIDQYYFGEPGLSYLIETEDAKILFDTGYSGIFLKNAGLMGEDISDITHLVISHGHEDHTWGMPALFDSFDLSEAKLVAHPDCFEEKHFGEESIGSKLSLDELKKNVTFVPAKEPFWITDNCVFLGEIPSVFPFEKRKEIGEHFVDGTWFPDMVLEDSALACKTAAGLVVITGCSHSGICNIVEYAKQVTGEKYVHMVIGGFHLFHTDEQLRETISYLESLHIDALYPAHCVSLPAKIAMAKTLPVKSVGVNLRIEVK